MSAVGAAIAVAVACLLVRPTMTRSNPGETAVLAAAPEQALLRRLRAPLVVLAVVAGWTVLGGWIGICAGVAAGLLGWRVLGRVESPSVIRRRESLERDLPMAVYLLGAALGAGTSPIAAVLAVADALPGPIAEEFRSTHHRLVLGLDPAVVWGTVQGPLRPLGRTMVRAHESGASVRAAVEGLSDDLRVGARTRLETLARSVEVRAAAPLGLCFLPAFVLLGVVPMTVAIFSSLQLFG